MPKTMKIKHEFSAVDRFSSSIDRMNKRATSFGRRMKRVGKTVAWAGKKVLAFGKFAAGALRKGALLATGALVGVGYAVNRVTGDMDDLAKLTRSLNFPIEEFQEWRFVAEQSGVGTDNFGKSLEQFTKRFSDAKVGLGAMHTTVKKSNPALLQQMKNTESSADAFDIYIKAIREAKTEAEKNTLAVAAFGREGLKMRLIADASGDQIDKLRSQMRENGVVTAEQAAKAEKFQDGMNRMKLSARGVLVDAISPLLPAMTRVIENTGQWARENRGLISQKVSEYVQIISTKVKELYEHIKEAWPEIKKTAFEFFEFGKSVLGVIAKVPGFLKGVWEMRDAIIALAVAAGGLKIALAGVKLSKFAGAAAAAKGAAGAAGAKGAAGAGAAKGATLAGAGALGGKALAWTGAAGAAGAAGYGVGTILDKTVLDPMRKGAENANVQLGNFAGTVEKTMHRMNESQLAAAEMVLRMRMESRTTLDRLSDWGAHKSATEHGQRALQAIAAEREQRSNAPHTQNINRTTRNQAELTIKDETGKAQLTKGGPGPGVDIQIRHTGGMK